jgi:hypothetical protein
VAVVSPVAAQMLSKEEEQERLKAMGRARELTAYHKKQAALKDDRRRSEKQAQVQEVEQGFMQV